MPSLLARRFRGLRKRPTLLCALCDPASERGISRVLGGEFRVIGAFDGDEVLAIVRAERPDLVLLMCDRPEVDHLRTCRAIRACAEGRDTPIIVIAASTRPEEVLRAFEAGANDHLVRPFSPAQLLAKTETWVLRAAGCKRRPRSTVDRLGSGARALNVRPSTLDVV